VTTLCERFGWFPPGHDATAVASDQDVREWCDAGAFPEGHCCRTCRDREPRVLAGDAAAGSQLRSSAGWLRFRNGASTTRSVLRLRGAGVIKGRVNGFSTEDSNAPVLGRRSTQRLERTGGPAWQQSRLGTAGSAAGLVWPCSKLRRARVHRVRRGRPSRSSSQGDV
jgi:hypothetical protein